MAAMFAWLGYAMYKDNEHWKTYVCTSGHYEEVWSPPMYDGNGNLLTVGYYYDVYVCDTERLKTKEELEQK